MYQSYEDLFAKAYEQFGISSSLRLTTSNSANFKLKNIVSDYGGCLTQTGLQDSTLKDKFILHILFKKEGGCNVLFSSREQAEAFSLDSRIHPDLEKALELSYRVSGQPWQDFKVAKDDT